MSRARAGEAPVGTSARRRRVLAGWVHRRSAPVALLAAVSVLSLGARVAGLGQPCHRPCRVAADHHLIFDETYYVNAARAIAGVRIPAGSTYAGTPAGMDPNSEHPQLAKLIMAGSIRVFGDGPLAWRLGSLVFGSLAILGLFALVRAAGGDRWVALGAAALMAADNLPLVHGRIGTLDIYVLALMIWGAAAYLRGRPVVAGALIGTGAAIKLVAPFVLLTLLLVEALRFLPPRRGDGRGAHWARVRPGLAPLSACALCAGVVFVGLLAVLDLIAPPYDPGARTAVTGGPFAHIIHMLRFGATQISRHGPTGIASYPWQWWADLKPIVYLNVDASRPAAGLTDLHPAVHFLGVVNPAILLVALPALAVAARGAWRRHRDVDIAGVAWCVGTFLPFELLSLLSGRTSYLYYMVIVMPGVYVVVARLFSRRPAPVVGAFVACIALAAVLLYPFTPLPRL